MPDHSGIDWNQVVARQFTLHPEKFGAMGQYSREMLEAVEIADYMSDMLMVRLTTAVMCGSTVSESPTVEMKVPASWRQHWKFAANEWVKVKNDLWHGRDRDGAVTTPPPWTLLLWPALKLWPRWLRRHPVKYSTMTAKIDFSQHVLYPEVDAPAQIGRSVIYEEMSMYPSWGQPVTGIEQWGTSLQRDPSRFLGAHEIASAIDREPPQYPDSFPPSSFTMLKWLERHGVNVDQLVKRGAGK